MQPLLLCRAQSEELEEGEIKAGADSHLHRVEGAFWGLALALFETLSGQAEAARQAFEDALLLAAGCQQVGVPCTCVPWCFEDDLVSY